MASYSDLRSQLLGFMPQLGWALPPEEVPSPPVRSLEPAELRRVLREPANNHASLVLVVGWGDGTVVRALLDDPFTRQKRIHAMVLSGEEPLFARNLVEWRAAGVELAQGIQISRIEDHLSLQRMIGSYYQHHEQIPQVAGCDLVEDHPLCERAERLRADLRQDLHTLLADRPQAYGNDILDSFMGLANSSRNARLLLPAPTLGSMRGFFGDRPVISIAAGPSVKRHLDRLRELQDRCVLVACDAVLHGLLDAGIDPHFISPLERTESINPLLTRVNESRCMYAGAPVVQPASVQRFSEDRVIGTYVGDRLYDWLCPDPGLRINAGLSTGTLSVSVAAALGTGPTFLVGHDLARDASGSHWAGAAIAGDGWGKAKEKVNSEKPALSGYDDRMIPGNDGKLVPSIAWWDRFRQDISGEGALLERQGRKLYNVNAHDRVFARIDHTHAAPLPDPASLKPLAPWRLPERVPERLTDWQKRIQLLPDDITAFRGHLTTLRDDVAAAKRAPPDGWDVEGLAKRMDLSSAVSAGNRMAFSYILRSALHNSNSEMHLRRRVHSTALSRWRMLDSLGDLCQALGNALDRLSPELVEIAHEHA